MTLIAPRPALTPSLADALDRTWDADQLDPDVPRALWDAALCEPLAEFARRPSKELRALVCELGWVLGGGTAPMPPAVALVIDGLHTGSLIIDDIEDGALQRRGAPAFHVLHGDGTAINAANWLYFWALERLGELPLDAAAQLHVHRRAIAVLMTCHQGQALDLRARVDRVDASKLASVCAAITRGKTAALVGLAMELAALAAGAEVAHAATVAELGQSLGTALQQLDDLGSLSRARRAKGHEDLRGRRVTWPWAWLPEVVDPLTLARLQHRVRAVGPATTELDDLADELHALVIAHGRRRIRAEVEAGLARAHEIHGDHPALRAAAALIARMEESYV
ncbi:MAG: polyprenyl synthetase family protein [Myxococcales bacterium]|nr:polyprenyl synthetase family protein [Myxococcales bacterium]